ncbi:hypothetical protein ACJX0J_038209, partial [Zea mays]
MRSRALKRENPYLNPKLEWALDHFGSCIKKKIQPLEVSIELENNICMLNLAEPSSKIEDMPFEIALWGAIHLNEENIPHGFIFATLITIMNLFHILLNVIVGVLFSIFLFMTTILWMENGEGR